MQTRDELEGLHNCREFSKSLECLYQAMQTQEKSFLLLFFPRQKRNALFMALIKREILTNREQKKWPSMSLKSFQDPADEEMDK